MNESPRTKISEAMNSPVLAVALLVITLPFAWSFAEAMATKHRIRATASELRQAIEQLHDNNEVGLIKQLVTSSVTQVVDGLREGMNAGSIDQQKKLAEFRRLRPLVTVNEIVKVPSQFAQNEVWVGTVANHSDAPIKSVKLNTRFYDDGDHLIDVNLTWLHNIHVLEPQESIGFKISRKLGLHTEDEAVLLSRQAKRIDCKVSMFDVVDQ